MCTSLFIIIIFIKQTTREQPPAMVNTTITRMLRVLHKRLLLSAWFTLSPPTKTERHNKKMIRLRMKRYGEVVVEKRNVFSPIMFGSFLAIFLCDMYQRFTNSFITQFMIYSQQWKPNKIKEKPPKRKSVAFKVKLVELRFFSFSS